jgi:hypothetical protein
MRSALGAGRRFRVDLDQLDEAVDAEVGESYDALVFEPLDPDCAVFRLHLDGDVEEEVDFVAEFLAEPHLSAAVTNPVKQDTGARLADEIARGRHDLESQLSKALRKKGLLLSPTPPRAERPPGGRGPGSVCV